MSDLETKIADKDGYKKTNLGLIPVDWNMKPIKAIGKVITGSTPSTKEESYYGGEYLFATPADLNSVKYVEKTEKKLTKSGFETGRLIPKGSVLFVSIGSTIGKTGIASRNLITNQQINSIKTNKLCSDEYLFYQLTHLSERIKLLAGKQAVPILNKSNFESIQIPISSVREQTKIAQIISSWDEAISKTEKLIKAKKRYKKGLMQRLLSGKVRFPEFEGEDWVEVKLGSILREVKRMDDWDDEKLYELISVRRRSGGIFHRENLYGHEIKTKKLKEVKTGDFLISRMQIVHGASAVVTPEFENLFVSNSYHTLVKRKGVELDMNFFNYVSQLPYFYHLTYISSYGVHIEKMTFNLKDFLKKKIKVPPSEAEQHKIAFVLQQADKEIELLKTQKQQFEKQKKGLMQQLLTGKVRVNNLN